MSTPSPDLWAVHILGPDDIIPMLDREAADQAAAEVNAVGDMLRSRPTADPELDVYPSAEVIPSPWSFDEHAALLAEITRSWLTKNHDVPAPAVLGNGEQA